MRATDKKHGGACVRPGGGAPLAFGSRLKLIQYNVDYISYMFEGGGGRYIHFNGTVNETRLNVTSYTMCGFKLNIFVTFRVSMQILSIWFHRVEKPGPDLGNVTSIEVWVASCRRYGPQV